MPLPTVGNSQTSFPTVSEASTRVPANPANTVLRSLLQSSNTVDTLPGNRPLAAEHNYALPAFGLAFGNSATSAASQAVRHIPSDREEISPQEATTFFIDYIEKIYTGEIPMPAGIDVEEINRRLMLSTAPSPQANKTVEEQTDHSIENILSNNPRASYSKE